MVAVARTGAMAQELSRPSSAPSTPASSQQAAESNGMSQAQGGAVALAAEGGHAPPPKKLQVRCPRPVVIACEQSLAHLTWDFPQYVNPPAGSIPRLVVAQFNLFWAEVAPGSQHAILDDRWHNLPSGDVGVPEVQVGGLRPGKAYAMRVEAALDVRHIDASAWELVVQPSAPCIFTTQPSKPSAVKPPLLVAKDRKSLKVKWNVPEEPGGDTMQLTYQLFMSPPPQGWTATPDPQGYVGVYLGPERAYKVTRLVPGVRYSFWVLARNAVGCSDQGLVASYSTQATDSITLQWLPPPGNGAPVTHYMLERDDGAPLAMQHAGNAPGAFRLVYAGPATGAIATGLRSGLHYRFRLRAENSEGHSVWSEFAWLAAAPSPPSHPTAIHTTRVTQVSGTLSWGPPADDGGAPVAAYEVEIQAVTRAAAESMGPDWLRIFEGCSAACTISSLQPGCAYRVRVRCGNAAGWGSWCMPTELVTAPDVPGAPGAPAIQQGGSTSLTLVWHPPRHDGGQRITAFLMEMLPPAGSGYSGPSLPRTLPAARVAGGQPCQQALLPPSHTPAPNSLLVYRGEEPVASVPGLQPGATYQFRVQACNSLGTGPWGDWSVLATSPDVPSAPMPPSLAAPATPASLKLMWQAPDARGSPITGYILQAAVQGQVSSAGKLVLPRAASSASLSTAGSGTLSHGTTPPQAPGTPAPVGGPQLPGDVAAGVSSVLAALQAGVGGGDGGHAAPSSSSAAWQQVYRGQGLAAEMGGLRPSTRYLLRLCAMNAVGQGHWSPISALTTAPTSPTPPLGLTARPSGPDVVRLEWQLPAADNGATIQGYVVEALGPGLGPVADGTKGTWHQVASVGPDVLSATVSGLLPGRTYQFRARALNTCGSSPNCAAVAATTGAAPPAPPPRPVVQQRHATHVRVRWEEPSDANGSAVQQYRLELGTWAPLEPLSNGNPTQPHDAAAAAEPQQDATALEWSTVYLGPECGARVVELSPGCRYALRVSAGNAAGWGAPSAPEVFSTALSPPAAPVGLEACLAPASDAGLLSSAGDGLHAVSLHWLPPPPHPSRAPVASYELLASPCPPLPGAGGAGPAPKEERRLVSKATGYVWEDLAPGVRYTIRVRAAGMEGTGHGPWSEAAEFSMPGQARGVTDSADSMSAASGGGDPVPPLLPLPAVAKTGRERGAARRGAKQRRAAAGASVGAPGSRRVSVTGGTPLGNGLIHGSMPSLCSESEDATSAMASQTVPAAMLYAPAIAALVPTRAASAAAAPPARNRVNTTKLAVAAVQKRPKAPLQVGKELRALMTPTGLRKAAKAAHRATSRTLWRYSLHLAALALVALVVVVVRWAVTRMAHPPLQYAAQRGAH